MDAEQDNDLEPSLPLLAHVRTLCQDPHHTQGGAGADYDADDVADADDDEEEGAILSENLHGDHASISPSSIFIYIYFIFSYFLIFSYLSASYSPDFHHNFFQGSSWLQDA